MPSQSGKIVLVLVLLLLLIGAVIYFLIPGFKKQEFIEQMPKSNEASESSKLTKDFYSKDFKIVLNIPDEFQVEDNFPRLIIKNGSKKIEVIRNGTNFSNLTEYIKDFDKKRKLKIFEEKFLKISSYPVIARELIYEDSEDKQKSVYLYTNNFVYIFSTSDEALYPVLDQIVQSFEYKP